VKKCPYCGRDIPDDAQFCPYCGRRLQTPASGVDRAGVEALKQRIDYYKHLAVIFLAASAAFLTLVFFAISAGTTGIRLLSPCVAAVGYFALGAYCRHKRMQLQKQLEELLRSA